MTGDRRIGGGICSGMAAERQPFPAARPAVRRRIRCAGKASRATSSRHLRPGAGHRHYVTVTNLMCKAGAAADRAAGGIPALSHGRGNGVRRCQLIVDSETIAVAATPAGAWRHARSRRYDPRWTGRSPGYTGLYYLYENSYFAPG
jgi:hypothetical protein